MEIGVYKAFSLGKFSNNQMKAPKNLYAWKWKKMLESIEFKECLFSHSPRFPSCIHSFWIAHLSLKSQTRSILEFISFLLFLSISIIIFIHLSLTIIETLECN